MEMPGRPDTSDAFDGGPDEVVVTVRGSDAVYEFSRYQFAPGLLSSTQTRRRIKDAIDTVLVNRWSASLDSELELTVAGRAPGVSWQARDLVLRDRHGRPCQARQVFVGDTLISLSVCRDRDDVLLAPWRRMRDSLRITAPPAQEGPGPGSSSQFFVEGPARHAALRQKPLEGDSCEVSCEVGGAVAWQAQGPCTSTVADLHFVADDCERGIVFRTAPIRGSEFFDTAAFITVFRRDQVDYLVTGAALRPQSASRGHVSHPVKGLGNNPGARPHYADDGQSVEFETLDGRAQRVPLFKDPPRAPPK